MEYLISKNDLSQYPPHLITLLARYYHLPRVNRNDLLWLIAIANLSTIYHYAEMTPNMLWSRYKDQLLTRFIDDDSAKKYRNAELLPIEIINADPTNNKKYLQWITTSYLDGGIKRFEDMGRVNTALKEYIYLLGKKLIINSAEQNINAFCGLSGCKQGKTEKIGLDKFLDQYKDDLEIRRKKEEIQIATGEIKEIFKSDNLRIIQPLTEQASCKYGAGTKWCTAARENNMFKEYSSKGPLYILIPQKPVYKNEKYQIALKNEQFMNEEDNKVNYNYLIDRFPELKTIDEFTDWINVEELYLGRINTTFFTNIVRLNIKKELPELTLKDLFKVLENNKNLEQLTIKNRLTFLSDSIGNLTNLQELDLYENQLTFLPDSIGNLHNLQKLNLQSNQLTFLPDSIGNLRNLQKLNLQSNQLTFLPDGIGNLTNLQQLNITFNQLTFLPDSIGNLRNLQKLNLQSNQLTFLPDNIGNLRNLQRLIINSNQLTFLPDSIGNLHNLQILSLDSNQLTFLPDNFGNLNNLQILSLRNNKLIFLPDSFGNLNNLYGLILNSNQLILLPYRIGELTNLQHLYLHSNQLTFLPDSIGNLTNLRGLTLSNNQLTFLPESIGNLTNIPGLDLTKNPIKCFPETLMKKNIKFDGKIIFCHH
jgi:Leucine-rich repeat (LRR) protein